MSNLTSVASGEGSVSSSNNNDRGEPSNNIFHQQHYFSQQDQSRDELPQQPPAKKKRNLPGNPDPEAEVIAMSPKSLLATNRFVCEICNKGFQRDQNLQLHRRGHNLPWKLKQRANKEVRKKVYVCPEPGCVHHDPARALGDLTGIKKHFSRKHGEKKWKCEKCCKKYAVQSDWKAHSKVCGTREYRCDCGILFSRRDSFITHRAFCEALAEETARAITTTPQFINLHQHDPLLSIPLKREQHLINIPPWLVGPSQIPSIDHHQHHNLPSPSSSTSSIFHQDQMIQHQTPNPNNNPSMGPTPTSMFLPMGGGPYHTQPSPHMSATALLQKAAEMGATMSQTQPHHHRNNHHQGHVHDTTSNTPATTAGLFGLNLSSRDHHPHDSLSCFENKTATTSTPTIVGPNPSPTPGPGPTPSASSSSFLHDMMIDSLSSCYEHIQPQDDHAFQQTLDTKTNCNGSGGGGGSGRIGGGGNEGLTRDFLGLRPLSHNEILTMAGLGNCMGHQQDKQWQG